MINGQKIWNSGAHYSDFGILVARSNPDLPKHAGLTFFILDMKTPGIEIRPIRQVSGSSHFQTRCSSPMSAFPTRAGSGRWARDGRSR